MGTVYAWGRSAYGSLGILPGGHKLTPAKVTFASLQLDEVIDDLVIGGLHVFARTNFHRWFSFGFNNAGQLGNNSLIQQDLPTLFNPQGLEGTIIERMVAGSNYSVCLTEGGELYAFGDNRYGHLGIGSTENALLPQRINLPNLNETDQIKTMAAAGLQTYATTEEGRIFAWGSNPYPSTMIGFNDYETSPIDVTMMIIQSLGFF
jgi:alpha-tubulin suppressor-like RCC1 family protein